MTFDAGLRAMTLTTALASAVTGGVLFAFSSFVMPALRRLPVPDGVAAMQSINAQAPRSLLMLPLLGSAAGSAAVVIVALVRGTDQRLWIVLGGALGIASFAITAAYHVPHNDALGRLDATSPATATAWRDYASGWVLWNHVRTVAALGSAVALVTGVVRA